MANNISGRFKSVKKFFKNLSIIHVFILIFFGLVILSVIAWAITPAPAGPGITKIVWTSDDNPARREQIEAFNNRHPNLSLNLDPDNAGMEKVIVQSLAGVGPDIFDCFNPQDLEAYIKADIALDVTDEFKKLGIDWHKDIWGMAKPYYVYKDRVYGLPMSDVDMMWYNKDIFDRMGIPYPANKAWTWDEFLQLAQKLTIRDENGRTKQWAICYDGWAWKFFLFQWGGREYSADGTRCILDSPEAIGAIQFMHDLVYKYKVMPSPADIEAMSQSGGWGSYSNKMVMDGRVATAIGGRWWLCYMRTFPPQQRPHLGAVESPHGPRREFWGFAKVSLINKHGPHREQALEWLRFMASEDYCRLENLQADGMPALKKYCANEYLSNPKYPDEGNVHEVARDVMDLAPPENISPFVNASLAERLIGTQLDMVMRNLKTPEQGMKDAVKDVQEEMEKNLRKNPLLRKQYDELVNKAAAQ